MSSTSPTFSPNFPNDKDAFAAAQYVEQVLATELQWINNRMTWLFVSQSFCITAYTILATSHDTQTEFAGKIQVLRVGLPILGIFCSVVVQLGTLAAGKVAEELADERARLTKFINQKFEIGRAHV